MTTSSLDTTLLALWTNWAFRLSLSSNELFHSNVLQYFAEDSRSARAAGDGDGNDDDEATPPAGRGDHDSQPEIIDVQAAKRLLDMLCVGSLDRAKHAYERLGALKPGSVLSIEREWNRMDLVVLVREVGPRGGVTKRPLFALEVKVKDYPEPDQLERYREALDGKWTTASAGAKGRQAPCYSPPLFLLTGMGKAATKGENVGSATHSLDFGELATELARWRVDADPVGTAYIELCKGLNELFRELEGKCRPELSWKDAAEMGARLKPYRLHSLWWKLWAGYVRQQCKALIEQKLESKFLHVYSGFTRAGNVGICWHWASPHRSAKPDQAISLGVQIEGASVRFHLNVVCAGLGKEGRAAEARLDTEAALLRLLRTHGVFARAPVMGALKQRWEQPQAGNRKNYRNLDVWGELDRASRTLSDPETGDLFDSELGAGNTKADADRPMLTGYANGPGNGFADIRMTLKDTATVGEVAQMVCDVLVSNKFSALSGTEARPLLLRVVQGFAAEPDKLAWLRDPTLPKA